jgi:broad specificity phosphatase PhoE
MNALANEIGETRSHSSALKTVNIAPRHLRNAVYSWPEINREIKYIHANASSARIYFFRHGETKYNQRNLVTGRHDTGLSKTGIRQAEQLRGSIPSGVSLLACSQLRRSAQTMAIAVAGTALNQCEVWVDARINEVSLGDLEGRRRDHIPAFAQGDVDFSPPRGESYRQAAQRVYSFVIDAFRFLSHQNRSDASAVVFCHAGVIRLVAGLKPDVDTPAEIFKVNIPNTGSVRLLNNELSVHPFWTR